ncbi:MAG: hypothetical protein IJ190_04300 [Prevotella sp.]|nr:hypothetical protein [Prevotella sp.]
MKYSSGRISILIVLIVALFSIDVGAKTTYIPHYKSWIMMDSVEVSNNLMALEKASPYGMYSITVLHEDVTKEKVKAIKRAKAAAGWAGFSAVMSGFAAGVSPNRFDYVVNMSNARTSAELAEINEVIAKGEQTLGIEIWVDNKSEYEILVADKDRGLTWYLMPHETLQIELANPGLCNLRVSDLSHQSISFATISAGSSLTKEEILWEDDDCWIIGKYKENEYPSTQTLLYYERISKSDFSEQVISNQELKEIKRAAKSKQE